MTELQNIQYSPSTSLLDELNVAYEKCVGTNFSSEEIGFLDALNSSSHEVSGAASTHLRQVGGNLKALIVKDNRFPGNCVRLIRSNNGSRGFYPNFVSSLLIRRSLETQSPEAAIDWLQEVLETKVATGKTIHVLWGVPVAQEIQLTKDVKIMPIDRLPDSQNKQWLIGASNRIHSHMIPTTFDWEPPKSALVIDNLIEPIFCDPEQQSFEDNNFSKTNELLSDITLVLTVIGPRIAISAAQWFTYDDPNIEACHPAGRYGKILEILPSSPNSYPVLNHTEAPNIVQAFIAIQGKTRDKIRVALQRLNQSLRRHSFGDRAVELSTAFEALLGDNGNTEMTHKIKVRSVRLIGGDNEVRKRNALIIKKTYDIRSKLVHSGYVNINQTYEICEQKMSVSDIIEHTTTMCADLIKIIILRGSIPDWESYDIFEHVNN